MNGRRATNDAAHPIAAACFLLASFVVLGITLGVLIAWGWSWLTTVLGALAVALSVLTVVCLIPKTDDDPEPDDDEWRGFGYASVGDLEDAERRAAEYEQDWRKHAQHLAEQDQAERGDSR